MIHSSNAPRVLAAALAGLTLAGCAVGPDYRRPAVELPASYSEAATTASSAAVARGWWKVFDDATLDHLVEQALANNSDVQQAAARIEEADAVLAEAAGARFPEVDLGASASRSRSSGATATARQGIPLLRNDFSASLSTSFELDFWGKLRRASEAARAAALSSRFGRDNVELGLVQRVIRNYLALRSLDAQLAVSEETLRTREESLRIARNRLEGGLASGLDVQQALGASAAARAQIADLAEQRALAEHQLALLTGELGLKLPAADLRRLPEPPLPPVGLPSALLEARPDVRQAEADLAAANARIGVAKAALFPSISLTGSLGRQSKDLSDLFSAPARIWSLGLGLDLPLFDAGQRAARVDQASARQKQALASYVGAVRNAFTEVNDALVTVDRRAAAEKAQAEQMEAANQALAIARSRYEAGYSAFLDVLDAQRSANDATLAYLRNRQARLAAAMDLYAALGGGWSVATEAPAGAEAAVR